MGEHEVCSSSSVMSQRDGTLATSFGQTIKCKASGVGAACLNPKSQAPILKVSGVGCQVSAKRNIEAET
jgi:hypothetical protein